MSTPIYNLSTKILESPLFIARFDKLQKNAGQKMNSFGVDNILSGEIEKLLLQASVLALSDDAEHRRVAQKIISLLYEILPNNKIISYAVQAIASRLGNFPVISASSEVFGQNNIVNLIDSDSSVNDCNFDLEILSSISREEEAARFNIGDKVYHFNVFQKEIIEALSRYPLVSFSAPTSFGKSFIVRHFVAKLFVEGEISRVMIVVPTKSLIDDFFESLLKIKRELNLNISIFTHARNIQTDQGDCIFVLTQERLSFLVNTNPDFLQTFDVVYVDEAHYISKGYRGFVLREVLRDVIDLCGILNSGGNTRYIFTSPIIKNPEYYKLKLFPAVSAELSFHREVMYSPVEKNIYIIVKKPEFFEYYLLQDQIERGDFETRLLNLGRKYFAPDLYMEEVNSLVIKRNIDVVLNTPVIDKSILYTTSPVAAHKYALELAAHLEDKNVITETEVDDIKKYIHDHYDDSFRLVALIKKGIGLHYGPMPIGLRRVMVKLFEEGKINYLICTSTLLEGVNLPAKNIFIFSDKYGGSTGKEKHTTLSFWNLIGRAGRMTYGLSGNVFCLCDDPSVYKSLIENTESEIKDPEVDVIENKTRKSYVMQSLLNSERAYDYFKAKNRGDIEYLIFELLTKDSFDELLDNLNISLEEKEAVTTAINEYRESFTIPMDLVLQNPGIDPRLQNNLYLKIISENSESLLGYLNKISNTFSMLATDIKIILDVVSNYFGWPKNSETDRLANRVTQWLHEMQLSGFIQQSLQHLPMGESDEEYLNRISRATEIIRGIDSDMSYNAPKYFKCFFDIVLFEMRAHGLDDYDIYFDKVESFLFSIESGISSFIGRYLFEKGVSRTIAIQANSIVEDLAVIPVGEDFFRRPEVIERLNVGLSKLAYIELKDHLG